MKQFSIRTLLLGLLFLFGTVQAEQKVEFQGHELHYIVFNSTQLTPEIAGRYGLPRSGRQAVLNLSVLEQQPNGIGVPVEAEITVRVRNLLGQSNPLPLEMIREQDAIYHIAALRFDHREVLWFDVKVQVPGKREFNYKFSQELWEEDV